MIRQSGLLCVNYCSFYMLTSLDVLHYPFLLRTLVSQAQIQHENTNSIRFKHSYLLLLAFNHHQISLCFLALAPASVPTLPFIVINCFSKKVALQMKAHPAVQAGFTHCSVRRRQLRPNDILLHNYTFLYIYIHKYVFFGKSKDSERA